MRGMPYNFETYHTHKKDAVVSHNMYIKQYISPCQYPRVRPRTQFEQFQLS